MAKIKSELMNEATLKWAQIGERLYRSRVWALEIEALSTQVTELLKLAENAAAENVVTNEEPKNGEI